jgi:hypothetical protein
MLFFSHYVHGLDRLGKTPRPQALDQQTHYVVGNIFDHHQNLYRDEINIVLLKTDIGPLSPLRHAI